MTAYADARPEGLNVPFRPGNTLTLTLTWPTGELAGRSFTSTLDDVALAVSILGDVMTIEASAAQTLAVDNPAQWLLTETTAGASDDILIGTWKPSTQPGTPTGLAVTVAAGAGAVVVDVTVPVSTRAPETIVHRFATDGWAPFTTRFVVTADGAQAFTPSVVNRRGRVTASAATNGNKREWFLHGGVNWADLEMSGTIFAPSNWDSSPAINRPQPGFVLRAQEVTPGTWRAWVVWLDIAFGTSGMLATTWQGDGVTLTQGTQAGGDFTAPSLNLVRRQSVVRYAQRLDAFDVAQYRVFPEPRTPDMWGLVNGDLVTVAGMVDTSLNRSSVAAANVTTNFFQLVDVVANNNIDTVAGGTVDFVSLLKSHFPRRLAVVLEGTDLYAKHWRPEEPEPDWGDATHVARLTPPSAPALPTGPGLAGVLCGHAHDSSWLEYGDLTFRRR